MPLLAPGTELGRYTILGKLATGGMSEIYLAKQSGPSGFAKVLVLKVILPHLAEDPSFMQMFFNEAKLAALLNHPNIVQIFDFGEVGGQHYIAMEHIEGQTLRGITRRLKGEGKLLPRPIAARIIADTCSALHYAHELRDPAGGHLRVIHRDVSLENIIVTYSGQVKLLDFGIAKASILESYTTQGTLKGKYNYMAPELIRGEEPDHRVDVFAIGVVMYATLLGHLPFKAKNHAHILDSILKKQPPAPREVDPDLPAELEAMTLKAMDKDRDQRYARLGDLHAELESYLVQSSSVVMPFHLAKFMECTFPPGTDEKRETYRQIVGSAAFTPSTPAITKPGRPAPEAGEAEEARGPETRDPAEAPDPAEEGRDPAEEARDPAEEARRPTAREEQDTDPYRAPNAVLAERVTVPDIDETYEEADTEMFLPREPPSAPPPEVAVPGADTREQPMAAPPASGVMLKTRPWPMLLAGAGLVSLLATVGVYLLVSASGEEQEGVASASSADVRPTGAAPDRDRGQARPDAFTRGPDQRVRRPVPARPAVRPATPASRQARPRPRAPTRAKLSVTAPTPGRVFVDGKPLGQLPITARPIAPGNHRVTVRSRRLGYTITRQVIAKPGRHLGLELTPREGTLRILVRPWARVAVDGTVLGVTPLPPVTLYEGPHRVTLENSDLGVTKKVTVTIRPGEVRVVKVHMDR